MHPAEIIVAIVMFLIFGGGIALIVRTLSKRK